MASTGVPITVPRHEGKQPRPNDSSPRPATLSNVQGFLLLENHFEISQLLRFARLLTPEVRVPVVLAMSKETDKKYLNEEKLLQVHFFNNLLSAYR